MFTFKLHHQTRFQSRTSLATLPGHVRCLPSKVGMRTVARPPHGNETVFGFGVGIGGLRPEARRGVIVGPCRVTVGVYRRVESSQRTRQIMLFTFYDVHSANFVHCKMNYDFKLHIKSKRFLLYHI